MSIWLLALATASAQDIDAHGFVLAAYDADARDPLTVQRPGSYDAGSFFFGGLFEYARAPLIAESPAGERILLLDHFFALNASLGFALHDRVRVDVTAPLYGFTGVDLDTSSRSGLGVGDTRVALMGTILRTDETQGIGLALVPHVDIPSGVFHPWLGRNAFAGGGVLAGTVEAGALTVTAQAGYQYEQKATFGNQSNPDAFLAGAAAGVMIDDSLGINIETSGKVPVESTPASGTTGVPFEAIASLRYADEAGAHFTGGVATGITQGLGASQFRLFVGGGFGAKAGPTDADGDGLSDKDDKCPKEAEVRNNYRDEDGCPDYRPTLRVWASFNGALVQEAELRLEGPVVRQVITTAEPFALQVDPESVWTASVRSGSCLVGQEIITVADADVDVPVEMSAADYGEVEVVVVDQAGDSIEQAVVEFHSNQRGCVPDQVMRTPPEGRLKIPVGPGTHTVTVRSGTKKKTVEFRAEKGRSKEILVLLGE